MRYADVGVSNFQGEAEVSHLLILRPHCALVLGITEMDTESGVPFLQIFMMLSMNVYSPSNCVDLALISNRVIEHETRRTVYV